PLEADHGPDAVVAGGLLIPDMANPLIPSPFDSNPPLIIPPPRWPPLALIVPLPTPTGVPSPGGADSPGGGPLAVEKVGTPPSPIAPAIGPCGDSGVGGPIEPG
ncbi:MAG: hypothetical protein Q9198_009140, partial [Flavoplaca austrocitrina]